MNKPAAIVVTSLAVTAATLAYTKGKKIVEDRKDKKIRTEALRLMSLELED